MGEGGGVNGGNPSSKKKLFASLSMSTSHEPPMVVPQKQWFKKVTF